MREFVRALFTLNGRLRRSQFWMGFAAVFIGGAYANQDQSAGSTIVGLLTLYVALCVYGKRLHDFDKTAWYMVGPIAATFLSYLYVAMEIRNAMGAKEAFAEVFERVKLAQTTLLGLWTIATLWIGIQPGQKGDNRFGLDPHEKHALPTAPPKQAA